MKNAFSELLRDYLEDRLFETKLFEMAYDRRKALDILSSYNNQIALHFIKVSLFPDHKDCEHWKEELWNWLTHQIDAIRLKPKGRKLKYSDYYEYLFDQPLGHEGAVEQKVKSMQKGKRLPDDLPDMNFEEVRLKLNIMYEELCDDLSIDNYDGIDKYIEMIQ